MRSGLDWTLGLVAAAVLFASAIATAQPDMGNIAASGATYTTGVVVAHAADSVTIDEDSGRRRTLLIDSHTVGAQFLAVGQRMRVDYHANEYGQAIADVIQVGAAPAAAPSVVVTESATAPEAATAATDLAPAPAPAVAPAPVVESREPELPATASRLPAILLWGLLAVSGAIAFRAVRFAR